MPPRRDPRSSSESGFPDISQLGEAIANAIQASLRPHPKTPLESVYNLKLPTFRGDEGHEGSERWLEHVEKTFRVMQSQGNLPAERWVETTAWFLSKEAASWWEQESRGWLPEEVADWKNFKDSFYKRFVPPAYLDQKKQEFVSLRQRKLSVNEYYRKFTDLSRYDSDIAANPVEMLRRFKRGTKKKWRSMVTIAKCTTYHEFYEVLLNVEDSENLPSDSEEEERDKNQRQNDKGKGQFSQGPKKAQSFKRSGMGSSSSSGGFSFSNQRQGGKFSGGPRFQRQRDFSSSGGSGVPLCRKCNNRHFGGCRQGNSGCFNCGQMGHIAKYCPQSQQRALQPFVPQPAPTQQFSGPSGFTQTGRGSAYHLQGDSVTYPLGQYQYPQDSYQQNRFGQSSEGYMPYQQNNFGQQFSAGGSQWQPGRQPQQSDMVASSAGPFRQPIQSGQGRGSQGRGVHANRGRGGRQQAQGRIHNISLQDAQNNPDLIMGENYTDEERNQNRRGGYEPATYQF
ncbi:uncharacterized protein [Malus domestica]|uniref:uncharacterized protein n=1 Tax=Malus domestica TaxID=3750 RepID=UPI0039763A62